MPHLLVLGLGRGRVGICHTSCCKGPTPRATTACPILYQPLIHVIIQLPHPWGRIFKTNTPSPPPVTLEQLEVQCNVCKLPWISLYLSILLIYTSIWNNSACVKQLKGSKVIFRSKQGPLRIVLFFSNAFDFSTHTLGSNSTATLGQSVVLLIAFAAIYWTAIMFIVITAVFFLREMKGKQSIKDSDLEFYSQATWEGLFLVPALDTMFSLCLVHHLISCKQECILEKGKGRMCNFK